MKQRCNDKGNLKYGARGCSYDPRWDDFSVFLAEMNERPPNTTLDKDINGGVGCLYYCRENCTWATQEQQTNARRSNAKLTSQMKEEVKRLRSSGMTLTELGKTFSCSTRTISRAINQPHTRCK